MRKFRISVRDLFWLLVVAGLCFGWSRHYFQLTRENQTVKELRRDRARLEQRFADIHTIVVTGVVLNVNEHGKVAEISAGSDDGVFKGAPLVVLRSGREIGWLHIGDVESDRSVGDILMFPNHQFVQEGDRVEGVFERQFFSGRNR